MQRGKSRLELGQKSIYHLIPLIESEGSEPDIAAFLAAARLSTSSIKTNTRLFSSSTIS
ncbi:hypothetical protein HanPI659440_Chr17g0697431 [Helianthus annuus]|nr:hypothetical protein HanPI659440_Chr17g0697431 [Helianthus annuus]